MGEVYQARVYSIVDGVTYLAFDNDGYGVLVNADQLELEVGQELEVQWTGGMEGEYYSFTIASAVSTMDQPEFGNSIQETGTAQQEMYGIEEWPQNEDHTYGENNLEAEPAYWPDVTEEEFRRQQEAAEEEARRQQEAAEEEARRQQEAAEEARRQWEAAEELRRQREAAEEEVRRQREAAEEEARRQQEAAEEEARRQREAAEEEARRQREAEEEARRQQEAAEEEARRQREAAEEEERRQREAAEEEARRQREAAEEEERIRREKAERLQMLKSELHHGEQENKEFLTEFFKRQNPNDSDKTADFPSFKPVLTEDGKIYMKSPSDNVSTDNSNTEESYSQNATGKPAESKSKSLGGWADMGIRAEVPFVVYSELRTLMQQYLNALSRLRDRLNSNKRHNTDSRDQKIKMLEDDLEVIRERYNSFVQTIGSNATATKNQYSNVKNLISNCSSSIAKIYGAGSYELHSHFDSLMVQVDEASKMQDKRKTEALAILGKEMHEEEQETERKKQEAATEFERVNRKYEEEYQDGVKIKQGVFDKKLSEGFSKEDINAYRMTVEASKINAEHYSDMKMIPEFIYIGQLCTELDMREGDGVSDFCQLFHKNAPEITRINGTTLKVSLPYCQSYREGIALMMQYAPGQNDQIKKMIMPLLLKLFMAFPSGKLEATMIDPLGSGSSFPDLTKLAGARSERVIDTKVWCESADIDLAISAFRRKVDDQTQAYGEDIESRLSREELKVLAITDFPKGFSQKALENLHSIVRNAAQNGVIVLIWTDSRELEELKRKNASLVSEIEQQMFVCTSGRDGKFITDADNMIYLEMDPMTDIIENKDEIIFKMANEIDNYRQKIEKFSDLFRDDMENENNWFKGENDKISIPLGIKGANTVMRFELGKGGGSTEHHALIAGQTGAGKTSLMHTLIVSAMLSYAPDDLQLYLVDFKEGIEFKQYTRYRLPNLRVVAVDSEREFGLYILKQLEAELNNRADIFARNNVADIIAYNEIASVRMPRILLIFDEVHELFRSGGSDSITSDCLSAIGKLVSQGRALGIHLVFACQDFGNCFGLNTYFSHFAVRIVVRGDNQGAASILSSDNEGIETLQNRPAGSVIYNRMGGDKRANTFFQVSYLPEEERTKYLELLDAYYRQPVIKEQYRDFRQRTLLTNVEDDVNNRFNRLIYEGPDTVERLAKTKGRYGILLGQGFGKESTVIKEFSSYNGDNLLIVGKDEKRAMALFEYIMLSVLYDELSTSHDASNTLCYVVDQSDADMDIRSDMVNIEYMAEIFPQIELVGSRDISRIIDFMFETIRERMNDHTTRPEDFEQLFFMIFGLNRIRALRVAQNPNGEQSLVQKLENILLYGPTVGVNSLVWTEKNNLSSVFVGDFTDRLFTQRIAYGLSAADMEFLVEETDASSLQETTAVYYDINDNKNTRFRPYNLPAKEWLNNIADVYAEITGGGE